MAKQHRHQDLEEEIIAPPITLAARAMAPRLYLELKRRKSTRVLLAGQISKA